MKNTELVELQREYFDSGMTLPLESRVAALKKLREIIKDNAEAILDALKKDLNKPPFEAYATETGIVLSELDYAIKHIRRWIKPKRVPTPVIHFPSVSRIYPCPFGVVLIISAWNYPFQLSLLPLIGAIAAGNCVILKPSSASPASSALLASMLGVFDKRLIAVVQGSREANRDLLSQHFDHIFFTGSRETGKMVVRSAAETLTPVTLELGGKSPCIIDQTANIKLAAKRIAWGKCVNSGQTCVAPDYVCVHHRVKSEFIDALKAAFQTFYGNNAVQNDQFPKIINRRQFDRLQALLDTGKIDFGGQADAEIQKIAPTILADVSWSDAVMQEEIFGPILPVLEYDSIDELLQKIGKYPHPLSLYIFTRNKQLERKILSSVRYGGGCINDTLIHTVSNRLPFGGTGGSGFGCYHGHYSFETFSHKKSIINKSNLLDLPLRYPPYQGSLRFRLLKWFQ